MEKRNVATSVREVPDDGTDAMLKRAAAAINGAQEEVKRAFDEVNEALESGRRAREADEAAEREFVERAHA